MPVRLEGTVVHGQQLGRQLGFPTANLGIEDLTGPLPQTGVYGGTCLLPDGSCHRTMINVGYRPTVDSLGHRLSIEAHLLDFDGDLYGQRICLVISHRIRDEKKMTTLDELRLQLAQDLAVVNQVVN